MPSKKKRYNARFPPARIKKIMQTDEDVGKVAAAVPVIISRALELFIESLILKANETTQSRQAKTLSTAHIKQTIMAEKDFDFLRDLVATIPDHQTEEDGEANNIPETKKTRVPRQRKSKAEEAGPSGHRDRKTSSDSSHLEVDEEDDEETESDDEVEHMRNTCTQENNRLGNTRGQENDHLGNTSGQENDHLGNTSGQENDHLGNTSAQENDSWGNSSAREGNRLGNSLLREDGQCGNSRGSENNRLRNPSGEGDSIHSVSSSVNNSYNSSQSRGNGEDTYRQNMFSSPSVKNDGTDSFYPQRVNTASSPLAACLSAAPYMPGVPPFQSAGVMPPPIHQIGTCNPLIPNASFPVFSGHPQPAQGPYPQPNFNHSVTSGVQPMNAPPTMFSNLQMHKPSPSEDDDYDA